MNDIPENAANNEPSAPSGEPSPAKKPRVAARRGHVAPSKRKSATKATRAKKANTGAKSAKSPKKAAGARQGSKTAKFLDLLKRSGGATGNGSHESHRLAGSLGPRIYLRRPRQENGPDGHVHQSRGRGAPLFAEELKSNQSGSYGRRGSASAAFLCPRRVHATSLRRARAISSNVRRSPSSTACCPVNRCHRSTATSTYLGSISMP